MSAPASTSPIRIPILERRLTADIRVRTRTETLGDGAADLQHRFCFAALQRLRVGIGGDEIDALHLLRQHVLYRVAATTANADHLDDGALGCTVYQFKHLEFS